MGMSTLALILHRARAGVGLLLTILALVTTTTAIIAGTVGYSQAAATVAARQALTGADDPTEAGLRVQTRQAEDAPGQDDSARRIIAEAFAPAPVVVQRALAGEPRPVPDRDENLQLVAGAALSPDDPGFTGRVEVVDGEWPTPGGTPTQGALHTGAATRWEVAVGDTLDVGDQQVQVTALWRPVDPGAAVWFGDPLVAVGAADDLVGPMIVDAAEISAFSDPPFVQWTVLPDADQLQPDDLAPLAAAAATLKRTLDTDAVAVRGLTVEGDLAPTAQRASRNLDTARALNVVPLIVLLGVCVIAVVQLARLLSAARTGELEVFLARGASRRQVIGWTAVEALVVTVVGTVLGIVLALGVLRAVPAGAAQSSAVLRIAVPTGAAVLAGLLAVTVAQVQQVAARRVSDRSGRARTVAALATLVFVVGAAALAWWQLRRYGSPLVTDPDGTLRTDLVAGAAPALLLGAVAVIALALLGPLTRIVERLTRPGRRLVAHLSATQVSRRLLVYAVPVVLVVLAVGATTVSGLYAGTSADLRTRLAALGQGADVRATVESRPVAGQAGQIAALPPVADMEGVQAVAPVWSATTDAGDSDALLLAAPLGTLGEVAIVPDGAADPADLAEQLAPQPSRGSPIDIPDGTDAIELEIELTPSLPEESLRLLDQEISRFAEMLQDQGFPEAEALKQAQQDVLGIGGDIEFDVSLLVQDSASGVIQRVVTPALPAVIEITRTGQGELRSTARTRSSTVTIPVPAGTTYQVVGIDLDRMLVYFDLAYTVDVAVVVDGERLPAADSADGWQVQLPPGETRAVLRAGADGGLSLTDTLGGELAFEAGTKLPLRATPATSGLLPLAVTRPLAEANNLQVGSTIDLAAYGTTVGGEVAAVVEAVPGTESPDVVLVDAGAYSAALLAQDAVLPDPSELWISGADPPVLAETMAQVAGIATTTRAAPVPVTDAASAVRLVFWVASAGSVLLAGTGVAAVAATLLSGRRPEVAVLRALGMPARAQSRARAGELAGIVLAAVAVGLFAGWLVGWAVVPELARSTTAPGQASLPAPLSLETGPWLVLLGLGAVAVGMVVVVLARRVRIQALDATYREEIR